MEERLQRLIAYCQGIYNNENGKVMYDRYLEEIKTITPMDLIYIENKQLEMGLSPREMLSFVDKLINVFYKYLKEFPWKRPEKGSFLYFMMLENEEFQKKLKQFKELVKQEDWVKEKAEILVFLNEMNRYEEHMLKLENILFPTLEKARKRFNGMQIMWALHDEVRKNLKNLSQLVERQEIDQKEINVEIGLLYFQLYGMVQKQELILFPAATEVLSDEDFEWMHYQSREYGFPYTEKPQHFTKPEKADTIKETFSENAVLNLETGVLNLEQVKAMLDVLPLDMTLVDDQDQVVYFSRPKERLFPRSTAIIGRNVRNCHPPDSVHVVEQILTAFKAGKKDQASFWIQRKDQFILIQYAALRTPDGNYLGTLEMSQEVSGIRALEGQRRILDWNQEDL